MVLEIGKDYDVKLTKNETIYEDLVLREVDSNNQIYKFRKRKNDGVIDTITPETEIRKQDIKEVIDKSDKNTPRIIELNGGKRREKRRKITQKYKKSKTYKRKRSTRKNNKKIV